MVVSYEGVQMRLAWIAYIMHKWGLAKSRWPWRITDVDAWVKRMYQYKIKGKTVD